MYFKDLSIHAHDMYDICDFLYNVQVFIANKKAPLKKNMCACQAHLLDTEFPLLTWVVQAKLGNPSL